MISCRIEKSTPFFGKQVIAIAVIGVPPMAQTSEIAALARLADECAQELGFGVRAAATGGVSYANYLASLGLPVLDGLIR